MQQNSSTSRRLLLVYHSQTGGTQQLVQAVAQGAREADGIAVHLQHARDVGPAELLAADAYVFASPEYLGGMSGLLKDFFDRSYYPVLEQLVGRPYACVVCAGSDGRTTAQQIARIATGWRLRAVAEPVIVCVHAQSPARIAASKTVPPDDLARAHALGQTLGHGLSLGLW